MHWGHRRTKHLLHMYGVAIEALIGQLSSAAV